MRNDWSGQMVRDQILKNAGFLPMVGAGNLGMALKRIMRLVSYLEASYGLFYTLTGLTILTRKGGERVSAS